MGPQCVLGGLLALLLATGTVAADGIDLRKQRPFNGTELWDTSGFDAGWKVRKVVFDPRRRILAFHLEPRPGLAADVFRVVARAGLEARCYDQVKDGEELARVDLEWRTGPGGIDIVRLDLTAVETELKQAKVNRGRARKITIEK